MNLILKALCALFFFVCVGCSPATDRNYVPSVGALAKSETLIMNFRACHNGCTKGKVEFKNGTASIRGNTIDLTPKEISDLDSFFLLGQDVEDEEFYCSLVIKISFKQKKFLSLPKKKRTQKYPCFFGLDDPSIITAELLVIHLQQTPNKTPYWRLSAEEQRKALIIF